MSDTTPEKVVFDCNVFLQYLLNKDGPGGRCIELALTTKVQLCLSPDILAELRELPEKEVGIERGIDPEIIDRLIKALLAVSILLEVVPDSFRHPIDEDDSIYINLAIAAGAQLIVSRDRHLLGLADPAKPWATDFQRRFPTLWILDPVSFLREFDRKHPS